VYRDQIQKFYELGAKAIERNQGMVDKFLGDGIMALFIPVLTGEQHALRAVTAGRELLRDVERSELAGADIHVGVGVDTGSAFVGVLGSDDRLDFTALGDTVNSAARLGSAAGPGHLLVSERAWTASGSPEAAERRTIEVAGKQAPMEVVDLEPSASATVR
jgi:adenylate cyclase